MGDSADRAASLATARDPGSTSSRQPEQKQHSLADTPAPWLDQLAAALTPGAALALVRTCRTLRDLVLAQRNSRLRFHLPIAANALGAARIKLHAACKYSQRVKLQLGASQIQPWAGEQQSFTDMSISATALFHGMAHSLTSIAHVELEALVLDALVPSWLLSCPNMASLQVQSCSFITLPENNIGIPPCPHLKQLRMLAPPSLLDQPTFQRWQHQLQALTGLQSLTLGGGLQQLHPWFGCCATVGAQLTQLILLTPVMVVVLPPQFPSWFPCVRDLQLPNVQVDDGGMAILLAMTSIRHLNASTFSLQDSHTHRTCSWSQLSFRAMHIRSFAMLPLDSIQSFTPNPPCSPLPSLTIVTCTTRRVVAAIIKCGGLQWGTVDRINIGCYEAPDGASVAELLPLMSGCRATTLSVWLARPVTAGLLAGMQPIMAALPLTTVCFEDCTWEGDAVGLVLPSLPPNVHTVELQATPAGGQGPEVYLTEAQLTHMCVKAVRPVTIWVNGYSSQWQACWQQRVQCATTAAGHHHVTLVDG